MKNPLYDGFRSHGEHETHNGTIIMFPERSDIWRENAKIAQEQIIRIANIIINYENVYFCIKVHLLSLVVDKLDNRIKIIPIDYDDIWARDISPSFISDGEELRGVCWGFNSWGGINEGAYFPWDKDAIFSQKILDYFGIKKYNNRHIVLEGGGIITDGDGTLLTTKSVLLNKNRNPNIKIDEMERILRNSFAVQKVIWIEEGLCLDETDGHIDNLCSFVRPGEICLAWTDDKEHPQYQVSHKALDILQSTADAKGRTFTIHKILLPPKMQITNQESKGIAVTPHSTHRIEGFPLVPSYINYYLINNALLLPIFECSQDQLAINSMRNIFPERAIIPINSREFLLGGGGLHCILHEIPAIKT